jgi:hypothetical protein
LEVIKILFMDIKLKSIFSNLSFKRVMISLNVILVIIFLIIFFFIGNFVNNNVYKIILMEDSIFVDKAIMNSLIVNLNVDKFKTIMENIEKKVVPREMDNFKNIFR